MEKKYLESGFDLKKLRVPELKKILAENNVNFPSRAKKHVLIKLFNSKIKAAPRILRSKEGVVKQSTKTKDSNRSRSSSPIKRKRTKEINSREDGATEKKTKNHKDIVESVKLVNIEDDTTHLKRKKPENEVDQSRKKRKRKLRDLRENKLTIDVKDRDILSPIKVEESSEGTPQIPSNNDTDIAVKDETEDLVGRPEVPSNLLNISSEFAHTLQSALSSEEPPISFAVPEGTLIS